MQTDSDTPLHWPKVALAILPGVFTLGVEVGQRILNIGYWLGVGALLLVCALLCAAGYIRERRLATWTFPALGILLAYASLLLFPSSGSGPSPEPITPLRQLVEHVSGILFLFSVLPALAGLLLARRTGVLAGLIVLGSAYVVWECVGDPEYALLLWTDERAIEMLAAIHPQVFFLIVAPIAVLRLRSTKARIIGFLLPILTAFVSAAAIGNVVRPYNSFAPNVTFDVLYFLLPLAVLLILYGRINSSRPCVQPRGV